MLDNPAGAERMDQLLEAQLQATLNMIPAYTWYAAPSGALTFVNKRNADYGGIPEDHPLRFGIDVGAAWDSHIPFLHPDDHAETRKVWSACLSSGRADEVTFRVRGAEGDYRWFLSRAEPLRANDGTILYWIGINFDIDERKQAEVELRRSRAYLADAQRLSRTGFVGMDASTKRIFWSEEAARIYGYSPGTEPTPELILQRSHPDDVGLVTEAIERAAQGGCDFDYEHRLLMPDGSIKHLHDVAHRVKDEAGNEEVVGAIVDITERKVAEQTIRTQEAELRHIVDTIPAIVWSARPDGANAYVNSRFVEYCGMRPEQIAGSGWHAATHPDDLERHNAKWLASVASGEPFEDEVRFRRADGQYRWHLQRGVPLRDEAGHIVKWYGVLTDIEDRKRAEDKIREQETELRQILDFAPQMIAVYGPSFQRLYANRITLDYVGVTLDEWRQTPGRFAFVHPDDRPRAEAGREVAEAVEVRLRKSDGTYRWFLAQVNPVRDDKGEIIRWYISSTDIDERKRAEERLLEENVALREEVDKASMFEEIVGASPALTAVLSRVSKVATSDSTVLITGETGTGKELVARAIHRRSRRASRAFVAVNCAAIPRDLIVSELFGHEKGAFTGAVQRRLGRFELADGGTIFLDEVGELPSDTQVALLRVLQEREFERVGGRDRIRVDVRVIAATNRNLSAAVADGEFRQDLFYRLNVFPLEMPPLRERREDIPVLVEYFIGRYARKAGRTFRRVSKRTLDRLRSYPWPGNVRELQNVIERSVIVSDTDEFTVDESWLSASPPIESRLGLSGAVAAHEKAIVEDALRASGGRVFGPSGAAARLGIPRSTLESKIRSLKIDKSRFRIQTRKNP
jgi:formate hydrogenlyase transcriptional activator